MPRRCPKCGGVLRRDRYACEAYDGCIQCGFVSFLEKAQPRTDQSGTVVLQDITEEEGNGDDYPFLAGNEPGTSGRREATVFRAQTKGLPDRTLTTEGILGSLPERAGFLLL